MEEHGGAGAGRDDDGGVAGEGVDGVADDFARGGPVAAVERGLSAARLRFGEFDGAAEVFEDLDGGAGDVVVEGVAEAGGHQLDAAVGGGAVAVREVHEEKLQEPRAKLQRRSNLQFFWRADGGRGRATHPALRAPLSRGDFGGGAVQRFSARWDNAPYLAMPQGLKIT